MKIIKIDPNNRKEVRRFIQFPFDLYKDNPYWVPPMVDDMKHVLNPQENPFYKHSHADFFLAMDGKQVVGRIAAIDNQRHNQFTHENTAFFYLFEVVDDIQIARRLFNAVFDWALQRDLTKVVGPKGLAQGDGLGMLVEGFKYKPAIGIPYNLAYYPDFTLDSGFEKDLDYLSGYLKTDYQVSERIHRLARRVQEKRGFKVVEFQNKEQMRAWIPRIKDVFNQAFAPVPGFSPVTEEDVQLLANRILAVAHPKLIKLICKDDELIGFLFAYHNISAGIQKAKGRLFPFGWYHLMREFKRTRWVDINGIGLLPGHQGVGATAVLYTELEKSIKAFPFEIADVVQIAEDNFKSFNEMDNLGVIWHKRHRIYKKSL